MSLPDNALFKRFCAVTVDTIRITDLRVSFKVEKTIQPTPNTCTVSIWNLTDDQRSQLEELGQVGTGKLAKGLKKSLRPGVSPAPAGVPVKIEAGYGDESKMHQIWLGELRFAESVRDGSDIVTTLSSGDGRKAYQSSRISVSFGPKTQIDTALRAIARALGVGEGNIAAVAAKLRLSGASKLLAQGVVISGSAARQMTDWCRSADLEWSIQDGAVQFIDRGKALLGTAILVDEEHGMVGSPSVDSEGVLTVQTLMLPDVRPGSLLIVNADRIKGNYRDLKCTLEGDTWADPFYITHEAARY